MSSDTIMLHKFTCVLVNSQLGSRQGQLGKTAVTKTGTYIVPMDRKTTEYGLEAGLPVSSRLITSL